ncbi:guanylate cyclase [Chloropicon primus]|uniref:guanylate cyclase n=1 Tax=Chloropicon primus TaxID=1764295 RepID=A0A5B8MQE5_9CHLO|nr:guanylate cyclase [Chloropicon primus]|eukprot:QDZ22581.1 guanylate cyclase [Chloropicon primus]
MGDATVCDAVPVQRPAEMTEALEACEAGFRVLRLGFHSSAEAGFDSGAMQGVATAIRSIAEEGLLDPWNTTIEAVYKAVGYDDPYAVEAALELVMENRVNAVIGGGSSGRSVLGNYVFSLAGVPQVAHTSTSPILSDKETFPTFSRVVPPDDWQGSLLAGIVRDIGWRSISILYSTDDYARELMQIFKDSAEQDGITVRTLASFVLTVDPDKDLSSQMEQIKKAKTNINALIVGNTASALAALKSASKAGLAGPTYVWMGVDGWFSSELIALQGGDPAVREAADGALGLVPFFQQSGPAYDRFLEEWRATPPLQQSAVGPQSPVNVSEACNAACLETPPWGGAYSYDATKLVATAWASVLDQGGDPRDLVSNTLLEAIRTVELVDGLTGNLTLDKLGNPNEKKYDVFQLQKSNPWAPVGTIDNREGLVLSGSGGSDLRDDTQLNFGLGPGVVPGDGSEPTAKNAEVIEWLPDDKDNAFYGSGEWMFAAQNTYFEWVPTTEEICDNFNVVAKRDGQVVYNTTCNLPSPQTLKRMDELYLETQFGDQGSQTWSAMYSEFLERQGIDDPETKLILEESLCSCPLDVPSRDQSLPPGVDLYVQYDGQFIPGFNPYKAFPTPPADNSGLINLLKIILPVLLGSFLLLLVGFFVYMWRAKQAAENAWKIKKSELEFDDPVKILGKGGQGEVVQARFRGTTVAVKRTLLDASLTDSKTKDSKNLDAMKVGDIEALGTASQISPVYLSTSVDKRSLPWFSKCFRCIERKGSFSRKLSFDFSSSSSSFGTRTAGKSQSLARTARAVYSNIKLVTKLRHPNIVQTMGAVIQRGLPPMVVMEVMGNGSMYSIMNNDMIPVDIELIVSILRDTAKGLRYLHEAKPPVIHGDLKLMNILVDSNLTGKLSDFGMTVYKGSGKVKGGSVLWMAPELLDRKGGMPDEKSDIYSLGVLMYEILTGYKPYYDRMETGVTAQELIKSVVEDSARPTVPERNSEGGIGRMRLQVPQELLELMEECWAKNPARRPGIREVEERLVDVCEKHQLARSDVLQQQALLADIFPPNVRKALSEGRKVEPEAFDPVTIFFSDIVGFTTISQSLPPKKVMALLDDMYSRFDALVRKHKLFKVETIGDAYMCVGGLPEPQADHTLRVARFALEATESAGQVPIDKDDLRRGYVKIRVGFHSGSVVASVVGSTNPRYCLFGDSVNTASRMESNSESRKINMSDEAHTLLMEQDPEALCEDRGKISIKGKGHMHCWFLKQVRNSQLLDSERSDDTLNSAKSSRGGGKYG